MKVIRIDQAKWTEGLTALQDSYQLVGPRKEKGFHTFKTLKKGESLDFAFQNTRLSAKSMVFPQSEDMFEYSLDPADEKHDECSVIFDFSRNRPSQKTCVDTH